MSTAKKLRKVTATEMRTNFAEIYNSVRYTGESVIVTNHGDESVLMINAHNIYPEPTTKELIEMARLSGAFKDEELHYE